MLLCRALNIRCSSSSTIKAVFGPCAQLSVFVYYAAWKPQKQWVTLDEGVWNSLLTYQPDRREEAWRFISYMFVHAG